MSQFSKVSASQRGHSSSQLDFSSGQVPGCRAACACFILSCCVRATVTSKLIAVLKNGPASFNPLQVPGERKGFCQRKVGAQVSQPPPKGQQHAAASSTAWLMTTPFCCTAQHNRNICLKPRFLLLPSPSMGRSEVRK